MEFGGQHVWDTPIFRPASSLEYCKLLNHTKSNPIPQSYYIYNIEIYWTHPFFGPIHMWWIIPYIHHGEARTYVTVRRRKGGFSDPKVSWALPFLLPTMKRVSSSMLLSCKWAYKKKAKQKIRAPGWPEVNSRKSQGFLDGKKDEHMNYQRVLFLILHDPCLLVRSALLFWMGRNVWVWAMAI